MPATERQPTDFELATRPAGEHGRYTATLSDDWQLWGPSGGYRLARERRRISLGDIVRTLRELETAEDPIGDPAGSALGHQIVRPLWLDLQEEMMRRLDALTLEDLCGRAHRAGIAGHIAGGTDFEI